MIKKIFHKGTNPAVTKGLADLKISEGEGATKSVTTTGADGKSVETKTATFALSWFWFPEAQFGCVPGVLRTRVGYTGGSKKGPSYHSLGDHTESVEIDYNDKVVGYKDLLKIFWTSHNSTACMSRQYMSAIFFHDQEQQAAAEETKTEHQKEIGATIQTKVKPYEVFYNAEDYHQKYLLRQKSKILNALGLTNPEIITSTLAAKLNGYVGGFGSVESLDKDLEGSNLPPDVIEAIRKKVPKGGLN